MFYNISFSGRDISVFDETCTELLIIFFFFTGIHDQLKSIIWSWSFFFFIILLSMEVCKVCWCTCFYLAVVFYRVVLNHPFCIYYYYFIINLIFSLQSMLYFSFHELLGFGDPPHSEFLYGRSDFRRAWFRFIFGAGLRSSSDIAF